VFNQARQNTYPIDEHAAWENRYEDPKPRSKYPTIVNLSRRDARPGVECNPWHDHCRFYPLPDWIAARTNISAGDKVFYTVCVYREEKCGYRIQVDKLADDLGIQEQMVYRRLRRLKSAGLLKVANDGTLYTVAENGKQRVSVQKGIGKKNSRIPKVLVDKKLPPHQIIVYARLCGMAGKRGMTYGSLAMIADLCGFCGCKERVVRYALRGLQKRKLIKVLYRNHPKPFGGYVNTYHFLGHKMFYKAPQCKSTSAKGMDGFYPDEEQSQEDGQD
jgi:predicted transcriptional regulator